MRANHGKRPFARKSHGWIMAIGFYRTSPVDIAPAMKAGGATYPYAHVQVDEEAGNVSGCVAESACCRKLSAQPCQPPESPLSFAMVDEAKSSPCGQSFWLPRSAQPPSARIRTHSRVAHPAIMSSLRRPPCRDVLLRLPWLRHTRSEPGSSGKARKTFAAQNSDPAGFSLDSLPSAGT